MREWMQRIESCDLPWLVYRLLSDQTDLTIEEVSVATSAEPHSDEDLDDT